MLQLANKENLCLLGGGLFWVLLTGNNNPPSIPTPCYLLYNPDRNPSFYYADVSGEKVLNCPHLSNIQGLSGSRIAEQTLGKDFETRNKHTSDRIWPHNGTTILLGFSHLGSASLCCYAQGLLIMTRTNHRRVLARPTSRGTSRRTSLVQ